ncbi:unnamed protein product [Sympodiomycopsis kandeliae]
MAFIQQGPSRRTHQRQFTSTTNRDDSQRHDSDHSDTAETGDTSADWSLIFPGRVTSSSSSTTLAPLHDGTGHFTGSNDVSQSSSSSYYLQFDDDDQDEEQESSASSSNRPPSLVLSTTTNTTTGESISGSSSSSSLLRRTSSQAGSVYSSTSPNDQDSGLSLRALRAAQTPRAGSPMHNDVLDTDDSDQDDEFEADLAANPGAVSAGLLPRSTPRRRRAAKIDTTLSASVVSSGMKRRHRRQAVAGGSVRSNKSLRSETSRSYSSTSRHQADPHSNKSKHADGSRTQRVAKLLGRMFDVDDHVLDALVYDRGPLQLDAETVHEEADEVHIPSIGFSHDLNLTDIPESTRNTVRKGWRELIDGRIVQDQDDDQEEEEERQVSQEYLPPASTSNLTSPSLSLSPSTSLQSAMTEALSSTLSSSTLKGVLPYFVPFSWRLLMRFLREWNEQQQQQQRIEKQEPEQDIVTSTETERGRARGRSTERKVLNSSPSP